MWILTTATTKQPFLKIGWLIEMTSANLREPNKLQEKYRLPVNRFDRVSSLLISLIILLGATVSGLAIAYFVRQSDDVHFVPPIRQVVATDLTRTSQGANQQLHPSGVEDAPESSEPKLSSTLTSISELAKQAALLSEQSFDADLETHRGRSIRPQGDLDAGAGFSIEPNREIRFKPQSLEEYARWLDYFEIELGVLGRDNQVHYASKLSQARPEVRTGSPLEEERFRLEGLFKLLAI